MKTTVSIHAFHEAFERLCPNNFTYEGLTALYEYFEQFEADTGEELELDVIAICCDFFEDTWQNIAENYDFDLSECETDEDRIEEVKACLEANGALVGEVEGGFVYRAF